MVAVKSRRVNQLFFGDNFQMLREQIATLREELEDLNDYLDGTEARVRDEGKPRLTHDQVKKRYGLK